MKSDFLRPDNVEFSKIGTKIKLTTMENQFSKTGE